MSDLQLMRCDNGHNSTVPKAAVLALSSSPYECPVCQKVLTSRNAVEKYRPDDTVLRVAAVPARHLSAKEWLENNYESFDSEPLNLKKTGSRWVSKTGERHSLVQIMELYARAMGGSAASAELTRSQTPTAQDFLDWVNREMADANWILKGIVGDGKNDYDEAAYTQWMDRLVDLENAVPIIAKFIELTTPAGPAAPAQPKEGKA